MIVDDEPVNVRVLEKRLRESGYKHIVSTNDPAQAIPMLKSESPDLLMLDIVMPGVDGLQLLAEIRKDPATQFLPVLILTATRDPQTKLLALDLGATDFLEKPVSVVDVLPRIRNALILKEYQDGLKADADALEALVQVRTAELMQSRRDVVECLARAGEYRDHETGNHVVRVGKFVQIIATQLGLPPEERDLMSQAALLHDVGKIGISDLVLLKPGRLAPEEFSLMKKHCEFGRDIICPETPLDADMPAARRRSPLLEMAARIAMTHHEWWDGTGYPSGLKGQEIPLEGRITAVADVFDALSSERPYKPPYDLERSVAILRHQRSTQFDPAVLDAFFAAFDQIVAIHEKYHDSAPELRRRVPELENLDLTDGAASSRARRSSTVPLATHE